MEKILLHGAGANHPVIEAWPFLSHTVNPLLALLPQFPTFWETEINDFIGLLEVAPSGPSLILDKCHGIRIEIVSAKSLTSPDMMDTERFMAFTIPFMRSISSVKL